MGCVYDTKKIYELRKELEDLIESNVGLTDPKVIKLSRQLDELINKCQSSYYNSYISEKSSWSFMGNI